MQALNTDIRMAFCNQSAAARGPTDSISINIPRRGVALAI